MNPERCARAALTAAVEPGDLRVARSVAARGAAQTWAQIVAGGGDADATGARRRRAESVDGREVLAAGAQAGLRFLTPDDAAWPTALDSLSASLAMPDPVVPPWGLWVRGDADLHTLTSRAVAVVGARAATPYGDRTASDLAADLTAHGWLVVSGGAYGIDAAAHRGVLAVGGTTVAVLACGADMPYPRGNAVLLERIAASGAVVSELPPGARPTKARFLLRNRLIAGLTVGTIVVEAARRSGALNTANWADQLGRQVGAVPGPVSSALSAGCHHLVRDRGAMLVTNAAEVLDLVGAWGDDADRNHGRTDVAEPWTVTPPG